MGDDKWTIGGTWMVPQGVVSGCVTLTPTAVGYYLWVIWPGWGQQGVAFSACDAPGWLILGLLRGIIWRLFWGAKDSGSSKGLANLFLVSYRLFNDCRDRQVVSIRTMTTGTQWFITL